MDFRRKHIINYLYKIPSVATISFLILICVLQFPACNFLSNDITYSDIVTYKNLTELKPETAMLYESLTYANVDSVWIKSVRLKLRQMYEYEKWKGDKNTETTNQIKIISEMFERHISDRLQKGLWSNAHMMNNVENLNDAFDTAIKTEQLKNQKK